MSESIHISPALSALCQRHGIDLSEQSDSQIAAIIPRILVAVAYEHRSTRELLAKSALEVQEISSFCPTEFVRDEVVSCSPETLASPNDIFSSLLPGVS